jgi:hypothetical protein
MASSSELPGPKPVAELPRAIAWLGRLPPAPTTLFIGLCVLYALKSGYLTASPVRSLDSQWLYVSGSCFREHVSPYRIETFYDTWRRVLSREPVGCPFAYLPAVALLTVPISFLPWHLARIVLDAVNVAALLAIVVLVNRLFRCLGLVRWPRFPAWLALGAGVLVSGVPSVLLLGQTTLFGVLGVLVALVAIYEHRALLLCVGLLLCTFKPQVGVIPLVFIAAATPAGERRRFVVPALAAVLVCFAPLLIIPRAGFVADLRASLHGYQAFAPNQPPQVNGMASLFRSGPLASAGLWALAGVAAAVVLGWRRGRRGPSDPGASDLIMTLALTGVTMQLHAYDSAIYIPLVALALNVTSWRTTLRLLPGIVFAGRSPNVVSVLKSLGATGVWIEPRVATMGALYLFVVAALWLGDDAKAAKPEPIAVRAS